ncbi:MAG: LysM peptidoglycan-binding domain-containing protein [Chloroflexi bacterium]|nr:LysM peptidoglycan-binding domain-containing protein [Chloroflexota bacterium]
MRSSRLKLIIISLVILEVFNTQQTKAQSVPAQAYVSGVVGNAQSYALSCESRSAADLATFWGVSASESQILNSLPSSDNPEVGFVGDVNGTWGYIPPNPYGVHANPIAQVLRNHGLNAHARYGMSWVELQSEIAAGRPVIVWVIGKVWSGTPQIYTALDGSRVTVAAFEHTMIFIGYDQSLVHLVDAGTGFTLTYNLNNFLNSWGVLGNMAVTVNGTPPLPPSSGHSYIVQPGDYLSMLAVRFGTTWQNLAAWNNISYPYIIYPGQVLIISPGGPEPTQAPTSVPTANPTNAPTAVPTQVPTAIPTQPPTTIPTQAPTAQPTSASTTAPTQAVTSAPTQVPSPTPTIGPVPETYTVKQGDHLMQIARDFQLDWQEIAELNGLVWPYTIYPGQVLQLPGGGSTSPPPPPPPTPTPAPPEIPPETYVVQPGDYLVALGRLWGISWQSIAAVNNIYYPFIIYPGQVLRMP